MKKLFFILLFTGLLFAQQGAGKYTMNTADDTVNVYNSQHKYFTFITIYDSAGATNDSVYAEIRTADNNNWTIIGLKDLVEDVTERYAAPGVGNIKTYLVNKPNATQIRFTTINAVAGITGDVSVWIEFINPW